MSTERKVHRVNINFSDAAYETLVDLAKRSGRTISQVLRDALGLEKYFADVQAEGGRVLVERDGMAREVILR